MRILLVNEIAEWVNKTDCFSLTDFCRLGLCSTCSSRETGGSFPSRYPDGSSDADRKQRNPQRQPNDHFLR